MSKIKKLSFIFDYLKSIGYEKDYEIIRNKNIYELNSIVYFIKYPVGEWL